MNDAPGLRSSLASDDALLEHDGLTFSLQEIVDEAGRVVGRPVAIDDRNHRLVVYTEHPDAEVDPVRLTSILRQPPSPELLEWLWRHDVRTATGPIRIPANEQLGLEGRVCVPIRCHARLLGFLWLIDRDQSIGSRELDYAETAAAEAGRVLYQHILLRDVDRAHEREFIRDVLSQHEDGGAYSPEQLEDLGLFEANGRFVVIVAQVLTDRMDLRADAVRLSLDEALMRARRQLAPKHGIHLVRRLDAVMLLSTSDPGVRRHGRMAFAQRLRDEILHAMSDADQGQLRCIVAVGGETRGLKHAPGSYGQAQRAAKVTSTVSSLGDVVDWERLGVYRLLAELPVDEIGSEAIHPAVRKLISEPRSHSLLQTVECYLDHAGDAQATARELFVHRTTLYHRLRRFERTTDIDMSSGEGRLMLHLSLKLARLQGGSWTSGSDSISS